MTVLRDRALFALANCDYLDSGLRDGDQDVIDTVRKMLGVLVMISSPEQLRLFLSVIHSVATVCVGGSGPGPRDDEIERLEAVKAAAIKVVSQTTPDAAYQLHDDLIRAIEAVEGPGWEVIDE